MKTALRAHVVITLCAHCRARVSRVPHASQSLSCESALCLYDLITVRPGTKHAKGSAGTSTGGFGFGKRANDDACFTLHFERPKNVRIHGFCSCPRFSLSHDGCQHVEIVVRLRSRSRRLLLRWLFHCGVRGGVAVACLQVVRAGDILVGPRGGLVTSVDLTGMDKGGGTVCVSVPGGGEGTLPLKTALKMLEVSVKE